MDASNTSFQDLATETSCCARTIAGSNNRKKIDLNLEHITALKITNSYKDYKI